MEDPGPAIVALLAGAATFLFSLAESALQHYSGARLLEIAKPRGREEIVPEFLREDERLLLTCQVGALLSSCALILALFAMTDADLSTWALVRGGLVASAVLLAVGRIPPLFLGRLYAEPVLLRLRPLLLGADLLLRPLTILIHGMRRVTERLAGRPMVQDGHDQLQEEILSAVEEGEMEGVINQEEAAMIERALHLRDADVADNMTPRTRMFALAVVTSLGEAVKLIFEAGHSRVPVYRKDLDDIVGVLYAKDVLRLWDTPEARKSGLSRIARKPFFVPETKRVTDLLDEFKRTKTHMAIVLDEYGGTAGLITIEDILEEIVGDIEDEFDPAVDVPLIQVLGEGEVEVDAQIHVDDLGEALGVEIDSSEFDTVGGLVFTALGRIPSPGDEFDHAGLHITVLKADERSVSRVRVVRSTS